MDFTSRLRSIRAVIGDRVLIAATKYAEPPLLRDLFAAGVVDMGENRVQALLTKQEALADLPIRWHFIGHLQTNKVAKIVNRIETLHSLDSLRLAAEIQRWRKTPLACFVEVNISEEPAKSGVSIEETGEFVEKLAEYDTIKVVGLMGMAADTEDTEAIRAAFLRLRILRDDLCRRGLSHAPCEWLSMGMSHDYPIAVQCGATHVRLGSILFRNEG
ncbi:MAG TPA: YggS family pyridoxal phosphate-dependent enzyme [Candidatus Izemoplasmatales bacterium]|nr:YggS family pyridoxal phosphate-dependent enzyme [Bacillota bacterium]HRY77622.1 YggS family pyridoxal phosphate-dependent enzyme [Candidatus Izemoplasmatales bacterium]